MAGLGLLMVHPAVAQNTLSLQSGDNVTVSGTGTTGTYQGQHVGNSTSAYSSTNGTTVTVVQNSSFSLGKQGSISAYSTIQNYAVYGVYSTSGNVTVTGGTISADLASGAGLFASNSNVTISGGAISGRSGINAQSSTVTVSGGAFTGGYVGGYGLYASSSNVTITGGTFTAGYPDYGGLAYAIASDNGSTIKVSGGSFLTPNGGYGLECFGGIIDLFGSFSRYKTGNYTGIISGTLLDGEAINTPYYDADFFGGSIEFNVGTPPAPEPSQAVALGVGALTLAGLCVRGRRRVAAV